MPDFADSIHSRYQLIGQICADPLSADYLAFDDEKQINVVLRCCNTGPEVGYPLAPALRTGLTSLRYLRHRTILLPLDFWEGADQLIIVLPSTASRTLRRCVDFPVSPDFAVSVGSRIAEALDFAHRHGAQHTALTPDTIVFDEHDSAVLADLEVGRLLTSTAWLAGNATPALYPYLAPEIFQGAEPSVQSDLYMLGAILYEILNGTPPPPATAADPEPPAVIPLATFTPDCPTDLAILIMEMLQAAPADRPRSAADVAARFAAIWAGSHESDEFDPPDPVGPPASSSNDSSSTSTERAVVIATWLRRGVTIAGVGLLALVIIGLLTLKVAGFLTSLSVVPNRASQVMLLLGGLVAIGIPLVTVVLPMVQRMFASFSRADDWRNDPQVRSVAWRASLSLFISLLLSVVRNDDDGIDVDDSWLDRADDIMEDTSFQLLGEFHSGGSLPDDDSYPRRRQEL